MKPEFQALRKFPQGVHIPPKTTSNDENKIKVNRNKHQRKVLHKNKKEVKNLLDIVSLNQLHRHNKKTMQCIFAKVPQDTQPEKNLHQSHEVTYSQHSKLPICAHLSELALVNNSNDQPIGLSGVIKPKFQALRKFAQGAYIPQSTICSVDRRKNIASKNEQCRKFLENNTEVKTFLDIISFNQFHRHKDLFYLTK